MKPKKLLISVILLILYTACVIPFDQIFDFAQEAPTASEQNQQENSDRFFDADSDEPSEPTFAVDDPFAAADAALFAGEIDRAKTAYQNLYGSSDEEKSARALYGLGRAYLLSRDYYSAIDTLNLLLGQYPQANNIAQTYFQLGQAYESIEEFEQAMRAYARYLELQPDLIGAFVYKKIGDIAYSIADFNQAIFNYQAALVTDPTYQPNAINLQIGRSYEGLENYTTAIQYYKGVYESAQDEYTPSTANLLAGQAYLELGMETEAYELFKDSVFRYPKAYDSFTQLAVLVNNGIPVDDLPRGIVDYYAGSYDGAVLALESYLRSNPDNNDGTADYYLGLSYFFTGEGDKAIEAYDRVINNFSGNVFWPNAWDERAYLEWTYLGDPQKAAETYLSFSNIAPTSPDAPAFLYEAGRILEREGDLEGAAVIWQRMMDNYPSAERSYRALFLAGIQYYRLERYKEAHTVFQRSLVLAARPEEKARAYLWIGKTYQASDDAENAKNAWMAGEIADPTDYYSIRCSEILKGSAPYQMTDDYDLGYDLALEIDEAQEWMYKTFNLPSETNLSGLQELENHQSIRAIEGFWDLGLYSEAIDEAQIIREEYVTDVVNTYRLMNYFLEKHLYQPAIYASRNILNLAGLTDSLASLSAPIYFTHVRFGAYFREITVNAAKEFDINPLLLFSLIRQESLFNPFIYSSAGASGLAQFIPSTGADEAARLGWPFNYQNIDLTRGEVSVRLGASYLNRLREAFGNNIQAAIAAYNGGWGFVQNEWLPIADNDADLFVEVVRAEETQDYLMQIGEFLNINKLIYTRR